jgi:hypothetical protein
MTTLVLRTSTSDPMNEYRAGCECAVLDVTPELVERARSRAAAALALQKEHPHLYELYFWHGYEPEFYGDALVEACEEADPEFARELEETGYVRLPEGIDLDAHLQEGTECEQMIVRIDPPLKEPPAVGIAWVVIPKHTSLYVTTGAIPLPALEEFAPSGVVPGNQH